MAFTKELEAALREKSAALQKEVESTGYYPGVYKRVLDGRDLSTFSIEQTVLFWHLFWEALPDCGDIRHGPFWRICDLAEYVLGTGDTDD